MKTTTLLERRVVRLDLTEATEPDEEKDLCVSYRHGMVGVDVPPILLQECEDGTYLVRDGHHRRLIALANGETEIEAYIAPVDWRSPSGSPFPYYHTHGEATVEWNGKIYDYGDMWSGDWRDGGREGEQYLDGCGDCSSCGEYDPDEDEAASSAPEASPPPRPIDRNKACLRVSCCGPFGSRPAPERSIGAYARRVGQEAAGQLVLGYSCQG